MATRGNFEVIPVEGQKFSNNVRRNIHAIMKERGMSIRTGLESIKFRKLYMFLGGDTDITVTCLQDVAEELGVHVLTLLVED